MKTAMQELMRFVDSFQEEAIHPRILRVKIKELLEKEKEQIKMDYVNGKYYHQYDDITSEDYYNKTYNQNK